MSSDIDSNLSSQAAATEGRILRRQRGADLFLPNDGSAGLEVDRNLPRAAHGARVRATQINADDGRVVGYVTLEARGPAARVVGRVDKRTARTLLRLESAVRDGDFPLEGADNLGHGQFVAAALEGGRARVLEVLGDTPTAALRIAAVIDEFQLFAQFPDAALAAAEAVPGPRKILPREDLRDRPFVTIDGSDAKDFDDAVLVEADGRGFRLYVAIADVTAHLQCGDILDVCARERGTSTYFPGRVLPMLPPRLSDNLCSLRPNEDRAALVCSMQVDNGGHLTSFRFFPAWIRSAARLIYDDVATALETEQMPADWSEGVCENVLALADLHTLLQDDRAVRGALDFSSRELQVMLDDTGTVTGMRIPPRTVAHRIIEECMILANVAAARALREAGIPFLARIHEPPSARKLEELRNFLGGIGLQLGGGLEPEPIHYARLLERAREHPQAESIQLAVLQSLQQAVYAPSDAGHFGLALEDYAHFTSPIRRYPDLLVHRALYTMLGAKVQGQENWEALGTQCSTLERRSDQAAWAVIEALKCDFLAERVGQELPGVITGVTEFGLFIALTDVGVSGLAHISQLGSDYFVFDANTRSLRGRRSGMRYELGQPISVTLAAVDAAARKIDLIPTAAATETEEPGARRSRSPSRSSRRKR